MDLHEYSSDFQELLDSFFNIVFVVRGFKYEPEGRHKDLKNICDVYQSKGGGFWLLQNGNEVIGTAGLKLLDIENGIGEVKCMYVLPECQGKGNGKFLLNHVIKVAREKNLKTLRLDTTQNATKAISLYRKSGFYDIPRYNKNYVAEVFMELKL